MKKGVKIICISFSLLLLVGAGKASNAGLFAEDFGKIEKEFAALQQLENMVTAQNLTISQLEENTQLPDTNILPTMVPDEDYVKSNLAFGIPSFMWGCCIGPVGVAITQIMTENTNETRKALVGCMITGCVGGGCFFLVALASGY